MQAVNTPSTSPLVLVSLRNVTKIYGEGNTEVKALDSITLDIYKGQFTAVVGPSGSGKSTLLHCLAGLDSITNGSVSVEAHAISDLSDKDLTLFRRKHIGFIFQSFNLVPSLTARDNILLPLRLASQKVQPDELNHIAQALGLSERLGHLPSQLSGGQQQRVAIARALITHPSIIVADEPTGNLDSRSGEEVLKLLRHAVAHFGQSVVMVTHDHHAASMADRVLVIRDGKLAYDLEKPNEAMIAQVI